jgi:hypothetical protein
MRKQVLILTIAGTTGMVAACGEGSLRGHSITAPDVPRLSASTKQHTVLKTKNRVRTTLYDASGTARPVIDDSWAEQYSVRGGVARSRQSGLELLRGNSKTLDKSQRAFGAVMAIAGDRKFSRLMNEFHERTVDANGKVMEIFATRTRRNRPVDAIQVYYDGNLVTGVRLTWDAFEGGFVLRQQYATAYSKGKVIATTIQDTEVEGVEDESVVSIALASAVETAVNVLLPAELWASCAGQALQAVGGFIGLVAGAAAIVAVEAVPLAGQAIATAAAVGWLGGWVAWTGALIEATEACQKQK